MTRPVVHFEIMGRDGARLQQFYRELFGWEIDANPAYGFFTTGPGAPEILGGAVGTSDGPRISVYVQVADLGASLAKVEALGGKTLVQPFQAPTGATIAQIADPEGNRIGLVQQ
jgi:predicted enzyme related to lactoylglutathione lyase